jgi:hypothetical protein
VWDIASKQEIARLDGGRMVELPDTTEIAIRNHQGWRSWDVVSGNLNKTPLPKYLRGFTVTKDRTELTPLCQNSFRLKKS